MFRGTISDCLNQPWVISLESGNEINYYDLSVNKLNIYPNGIVAFNSSLTEFYQTLQTTKSTNSNQFARIIAPYYRIISDQVKDNIKVSISGYKFDDPDLLVDGFTDVVFSSPCQNRKKGWSYVYFRWKIENPTNNKLIDDFEGKIHDNHDISDI